MRNRLTSLFTLAGFALVMGAARLSAQAATTPTTVCKDGSPSASEGRGACSGHGGVDAKATAAAKKAAKKALAAEKRAAKKAAEVKCTDGSMSKPGRGACSHHGGIAKA